MEEDNKLEKKKIDTWTIVLLISFSPVIIAILYYVVMFLLLNVITWVAIFIIVAIFVGLSGGFKKGK